MFAIPGWLMTLFLAMSPISELRGAIPVAIGVYGFDPLQAYALAVAGNLLPVVPLLLFLDPVSSVLMRYRIGNAFFSWLFSRTRRKYIQKHERFGLLALVIFVAIPLPVTGAWTGCAIAFLVGFKFWQAFPAIALGVMIAGLVVTSTVLGVLSFLL